MKNESNAELLFQVFALLISIIIVHAIYVTAVRPHANMLLEQQRMEQETTGTFEMKRTASIVLKDPEQESCLILGLWVIAIMGYKVRRALRERRLFGMPLLDVQPGTSILSEDIRQFMRPLQALPDGQREYLLPRALLSAFQRFGSTGNLQDASAAVGEACDTEADRLDSELSMVRYVIWAIPSIGFIGTVRGIGDALSQAQRAVTGDIIGVTVSLGVAFNSTLVALVISMVVMFLMHQLQLMQERLVLDVHNYCDVNLLRHLKVR